jgi:2-phosphosulfolactate phosphatase
LKIDLFFSAAEIPSVKINGRVAVIIDVLRASTSIITALANGCRGILPVSEIDEAKQLAQQFPPESILLGGERNEMPIPGFDLSNSPLEYTADKVIEKRIIFTSSNGAKLFNYIRDAHKAIVAGFVNVTASSEFIIEHNADVSIMCAGKNRLFGIEDAVCGGMIVDKILNKTSVYLNLNDGAVAAQRLYLSYADNITEMLYQTSHGKRLVEIGSEQDIKACGQLDSFNTIPILRQNELVSLS